MIPISCYLHYDPDDDMVIECAVIGQATHIVTGDKHLLNLSKYQEIVIMKATEFINLLSESSVSEV